MRKLLLAGALALGAFPLAACQTTSSSDSGTITAIQQAAVAACSFLPTVETVAGILAAGSGTVATAAAIAEAICAAVTPSTNKSARLKLESTPTVDGVPIVGVFVK